MGAESSPLNGAYYGPSIPPTRSYHRPSRGSGSGSGICCFPCCLLSLLFKIIFSILFFVGLLVLIFWLIFRPNPVKFHVVDASLTQFNLADNNMLQYNLTLDINIRNPNKRIAIYYDSIEARAFYDGKRFGSVYSTPFYQGHKNTSVLRPVIQGQAALPLDSSQLRDFNKDKNDGIFDIEVKLYLRIRFKLARIKTRRMKPKIECDLKVPLGINGTTVSVNQFRTTKCKLNF